MKRPIALVVVAAAIGCGDPASLSEVAVPWQAPLALSCDAQRAAIGARMQADLLVGGYEAPCPLEVNAATLEVSGFCKGIGTSIVRPLLLTYRLRHPTDTTRVAALAYFVSYVSLCRDAIDPDADVVQARFVDDGVSGVLLYRTSDLASLPTAVEGADSECAAGLTEAKGWAGAEIAKRRESVDTDRDCGSDALNPVAGCSNLEEACQGTLLP